VPSMAVGDRERIEEEGDAKDKPSERPSAQKRFRISCAVERVEATFEVPTRANASQNAPESVKQMKAGSCLDVQ
jgi:hypothetical protein